MKRNICILAGALLALGAARAAAAPTAVRIGAISFVEKGEISLRNSPVVARVMDEGWLASELGKRGAKLEWVPIIGGDTGAVTNEAFASGRIDFANYGDFPSITLNASGVRTQVVVPNGRGNDMYLVVPPGSSAKTVLDLKGKRISVHRGRPWDLGLQKLLEAHGLTQNDFKIFNLKPDAGAAALAAGKVDAHFALNGHLLQQTGVGKILWTTEGKPLHFKMRSELWATKAFIDQQPALTQLVATAYVKAIKWVAEDKHKDWAVQNGTRNGTPESVVRKNYDDDGLPWHERWNPLPDEVVRAHYVDVVKFATERRLIRKALRPEELIEPRFVEAALKELKLEHHWKPWALAAEEERRP